MHIIDYITKAMNSRYWHTRVQNYVDRGTFATIELVDVNNINATPIGTGIQSSMYRANTSVTLRANLADNETGTITVSISTCRAT